MEAYDAEEERKAKARQAAMAEDGWTVVQRAKVACSRSSDSSSVLENARYANVKLCSRSRSPGLAWPALPAGCRSGGRVCICM